MFVVSIITLHVVFLLFILLVGVYATLYLLVTFFGIFIFFFLQFHVCAMYILTWFCFFLFFFLLFHVCAKARA